jgi:hypothetical protein
MVVPPLDARACGRVVGIRSLVWKTLAHALKANAPVGRDGWNGPRLVLSARRPITARPSIA